MAHWRASALKVWEELPHSLQLAALGLDPVATQVPASELRRRLETYWHDPRKADDGAVSGESLRAVARVGGFRGIGGPFLTPPKVVSNGEDLIAYDGEHAWTIHADHFGACCQRLGAVPASRSSSEAFPTLLKKEIRERFPELAKATSMAMVAQRATAAVTVPHSHWVYLLTWGGGS
ncbi:MAG: hypothetical protein ACNA8W_18975 [Bradymonadaceae bacterium]